MKKVIIIVILLALAGGGVLGGMAFMGMGGPLAQFVTAGGADATPKAAPPPAAPPTRLIDMETLGVPIIEGSAVSKRVFLNLQLDVPPDKADQVKAILPRLQSAFVQELLVYLPRHLRDRDKIDAVLLQQHLLMIARKTAGGRVRAVVIKNWVEQN